MVNGRLKTGLTNVIAFKNVSVIDYLVYSVPRYFKIDTFEVINTKNLFCDGYMYSLLHCVLNKTTHIKVNEKIKRHTNQPEIRNIEIYIVHFRETCNHIDSLLNKINSKTNTDLLKNNLTEQMPDIFIKCERSRFSGKRKQVSHQ